MFEKNIVVRCYQVLFLFLIILQSCTKDPQYIDTTKDSDNLYIVQTDTLQPAFVCYRLDSFQTSGNNRSIIGKNTDPFFGVTTSRSFLRFNIAAGDYKSIGSQTEKYDSIRLIMHVDHSYAGDTTMPWSASVHTLTQDLDPTIYNATDPVFQNDRQLSFNADEIGSANVVIRPHVDDSVVIKLDDALGSEIFGFYKSKNENVSNNTFFQLYFKGICIQPGASSNLIYGFNAADTGTLIRLYYHDDVGTHLNKQLDFKSQGGNYQFNNIVNDPTGTVTENIVKGHDTPSEQLSHRIFVSDLAGVVTKFTLPSVKSLATLPDYVRLQSVQLDLKPVPTTYINYPLIPFLGLGVSNESSTFLTPLTSSSNTVQNGSLLTDQINGVGTGYTYDLSAVSRAEIASTTYTANTLYLQPLSSNSSRQFSLNRLVAADNSSPSTPSKVITQMLFFKK